MGTEQLDAEVVETVAGVVRLLRRAAELAWAQAELPPVIAPATCFGDEQAADEASSLLPRRARLEEPTPVGQNPAELLASAGHLLHQICVTDAPPRLLRASGRWSVS